MLHFESIAQTQQKLDELRCQGKTVGLVATMGFLHAGHASLIRRSSIENDVTLVTIFVNPTQFSPDEDLSEYPRDLQGDLELCAESGASIVLTPSVAEMYPLGLPTLSRVNVDQISAGLEGQERPTHFEGVATVVAKLFNIGAPCKAYFGEKDYQQLALVRRMALDLGFRVEIVGCPIIRESNGLAMSSRNTYLSSHEKEAASVLNRALRAAVDQVDDGERSATALKKFILELIATQPLVSEPDYVAIVDAHTLEPLEVLKGEVRIILAAQVGRPRLLDNIGLVV